MSKVRVALIGAGSMANSVHYPSLAGFSDVELAGLCDLDAGRLEKTAKRFGIAKTFGDYRGMLEQTKPDAVYALMPPHVLYDVAMDVLERGHHLFIEKPPAVTTHQTRCLARMAEQKGVVTAVGFQRRYHPLLLRCLQEVRRVGEVHQVTAAFIKNAPPKQVHPYYRGAIDILHCDAIHAVDALRYCCGLSEVSSVRSSVRTLDAWYEVSFNALVEFENGALGILQTNWRSGRRFFKFDIHGYGACSYLDLDGEGAVWTENREEPLLRLDAKQAAGSQENHVVQGFEAEGRAFIDAVKSGTQPHNSLQDAVKSMALVDAIYAAARPAES